MGLAFYRHLKSRLEVVLKKSFVRRNELDSGSHIRTLSSGISTGPLTLCHTRCLGEPIMCLKQLLYYLSQNKSFYLILKKIPASAGIITQLIRSQLMLFKVVDYVLKQVFNFIKS